MFLHERAVVFGVDPSAISYSLKRMKIVTSVPLGKKERRYLELNIMQIKIYLKKLYKLTNKYGIDNIIYFDDSGFKANTGRLDGWAKRGKNGWLRSYFKAHAQLNWWRNG